MGFFKNIGTESAMLCKKLADYDDLKTVEEDDISPWSWPSVYIMRNTGTCAVVRYLLDLKRINVDDLINYIHQSKQQLLRSPATIKSSIKYNIDRIAARMYNPKTKTLYCYGGPKGGMTDKRAERIFNDAVELLKYLNIDYVKEGSSKQHNIRIVFN